LDVRLNVLVTYISKYAKDERKGNKKKQHDLCKTYDTHEILMFVLFLAAINHKILMEGESQIGTCDDVTIILQHEDNQMPH
jgi:hypothetical protein